MTDPIQPPVARQAIQSFSVHGIEREDSFHWLRDPRYPDVEDPEIRAYLEAENRYLEQVLAPHDALKKELFEELKARLVPDDAAVPAVRGRFTYQTRYVTGEQYPVTVRWPRAGDGEQVVLDVNALAKGKDFVDVRRVVVSPSHDNLLSYSVDYNGSERFTLVFVDLDSRQELGPRVENTSGAVVWALDGKTVFYARLDDQLRPSRIFRHRVGDDPAKDELIYQEMDPSYWTGLGSTLDNRYVLIESGDKDTSEIRLIDAQRPDDPPRVVAPRKSGHEYDLVHHRGRFFIRTNDRDPDFRVVEVDAENPAPEHWREVIGPAAGRYITGLEAFSEHLVVFEREAGLPHVTVRNLSTGSQRRVAFPDPTYAVRPRDNFEFESRSLRIEYQSLVTPRTVIDVDLETGAETVRKVQRIPSGYDASQYVSERVVATADDGTKVPVSIVRRRDTALGPETPVYLYGYGAYGINIDATFSENRLSLLDRGFVYAIAHVRGGSDLGRRWYDHGKLVHKANTFGDTIAVARHLIATGITGEGQLTLVGGSAGGMLVGAVINRAPELFRAAVAHVPFVDCLNTMLDSSLPLTPPEYTEWGNPEQDLEVYERIASYSPYDNVRAQAYPHLLVTAGISDPRVTYWEPAKWVAKLRQYKTDDHLLLFRTNMSWGHRGASGRYEALEELALEYTFLLAVYGRAAGRVTAAEP